MKKCVGMFDFDRKSGCEADGEKHDRFVIINSSEGRRRHSTVLCPPPPVLSLSSDEIKIIVTTSLSFIASVCIP